MRYSGAMPEDVIWNNSLEDSLEAARTAQSPADALPLLRQAADALDSLINENMSAALLAGESSIQHVAGLAGFSENAVGPRLARSSLLSGYARPDGRVTASGVTRAVYDRETGTAPIPQPMKFVARKPRKEHSDGR